MRLNGFQIARLQKDFHAGQRLVMSSTYDLPFGHRRRWLRQGALAQALGARVEFFNLFKRPNFDLPDRIFDSNTFAALRSANAQGNKPPRQIQLSFRYWF